MHGDHAEHRTMLNELSVAQNERGKEVSLAILIMVLHELFELGAHVLCSHVWRVRHYCRVFAGKIPCLGENLIRAFTQKRISQCDFVFSVFCR